LASSAAGHRVLFQDSRASFAFASFTALWGD
jgi:hypothetical protein